MREIHRRSLWQVLAVYLVGAATGLGIIQALTEGLGLPFWFPWFAIVLFIIGLPIVLATAFLQGGPPRFARGNPISSAGSPHPQMAGSEVGGLDLRHVLTWRRSISAGVLAFAVWGMIAAGWLLARGGVDLLVAEPLEFVSEGDRVLASSYALAGEVDAANRVLAQIDSFIEIGHYRTGSGHMVRAAIALREDRPHEAAEHLQEARSLDFGGLDPLGCWVWAEAHATLGSYEEASAGYERILNAGLGVAYASFYLGPLWPLAHERMGTTYLAHGDTAVALRHLSTFAELWSDADPELQPRVGAARRTIAQLLPDRRVPPGGTP